MNVKRVTECSLELVGGPMPRNHIQVQVGNPHMYPAGGGGGGMHPTYPTVMVKWSLDGDTIIFHQGDDRIKFTPGQLSVLVGAAVDILSDLKKP